MTWKQALATLSGPDAAMEALDPFYVPARTNEAVAFIGVASTAWVVPVAPFFVSLTSQNLAIITLAAVIASGALYRGIQARRYRLRRMAAVSRLRARLLESDDRMLS